MNAGIIIDVWLIIMLLFVLHIVISAIIEHWKERDWFGIAYMTFCIFSFAAILAVSVCDIIVNV